MARPTIYDVAQRAGVSTATVSFAFRNPEKIRPQTRQTVLKAAEELGYVPSATARGLARGRTGVFGLFSFDMLIARRQGAKRPIAQPHDPLAFPLYRDEVQRGFELGCLEAGYSLLLGGSDDKQAIAELAGRVDGLAVLPGPMADASILRVSKRVPVALVSRESIGDGTYGLIIDNAGGIEELVEHLVTAHGARSFEFIGHVEAYDFAVRFAALCAGLQRRGIAPPSAPLDEVNLAVGIDMPGVHARRLAQDLPDVFVCASDQIAIELLRQLHQCGVEVPHDVIVTGFDGILAGLMSCPSLTTVTQPFELIGREAVRILHEACEGREPASSGALPVHLTPRASCGCTAERLL